MSPKFFPARAVCLALLALWVVVLGEEAEVAFTDYDCRRVPLDGRLLDWSAWRSELQDAKNWLATSQGVLAKLTTLKHRDRAMEEFFEFCKGGFDLPSKIPGPLDYLIGKGDPVISVSYRIPKQEFEKGTPEVAPDEAVANADQEVAEGLCNSLSSSIECPLGLLMADLLRMLACLDRSDECTMTYEPLVRTGLSHFGLRVLMGTNWPIYQALHSDVWERRLPASEDPRLVCVKSQILDWPRFKRLFDTDDWYQPAVDVAYGPELATFWREAAIECPLGFAVANLIKAMLCSHTESICFRAHETMMGAVLEETSIPAVASSGWPILRLLGHVSRVVRRHGFALDFHPHELLHLPMADPETSRSMQDLQDCLPQLHRAADATAKRWNGLRLVYATMAYGQRFSPYLSRFLGRGTAVGINAMVSFCLDDDAWKECRKVSGYCVRGTPSILNKFTLPLVLLHENFDVFWLDLDVFLFQSPTAAVAKVSSVAFHAELLISGAFAVDCVCSGVVLFRSTSKVKEWLKQLLIWMYEHPYEHDQKLVSAFLRAGERVAFDDELPVRMEDVPNWMFLDPETQFVSARHVDAAGWTGDPDDIVVFHMLHGDSDQTYASRQFAQRNHLGSGYTSLLDLFYNQTEWPEFYTTPVLPHHLSSELKDALYRSWWPTRRPQEPGKCNETVGTSRSNEASDPARSRSAKEGKTLPRQDRHQELKEEKEVTGLKAPSSSPALASRSGLFSAPSPPASTKGRQMRKRMKYIFPTPTAVATSTTSTMEPPADGGVAPVPSAGNAHSPVAAPVAPLEAPKNGEADFRDRASQRAVLRKLWKIYAETVLPLEQQFFYQHFGAPPISLEEFEARPQVLLLGQYSTGKTSMVPRQICEPWLCDMVRRI
eukprot:symbB.v1.2.002443.t3/scaffold126.1/size312799/7